MPSRPHRAFLFATLIAAVPLAGCVDAPRAIERAPTHPDAAPLAYVAGAPVFDADLRPALIEAAGARVLTDAVLGRLVADRLVQLGITPTETDRAAEVERLAQALDDDPDTAARLLRELRERRGLGEARFAELVARNAGLRALIRDRVDVREPAVQQAFRLAYGRSVRVRLIVAPSLAAATALRTRAAAPGVTDADFARLAAEESTDASAAQGGLLSPLRPDDNSYPAAILDAADRLAVDEVSPPIAVGGGFALLRCLERLPAQDVELDDVRPQLEADVRRRAERVLMQQAARELVSGAKVVVLDPVLKTGWERERAGLLAPR